MPCIICHDLHAGYDTAQRGLMDMAYAVRRGYDAMLIGGADGSTSFWIDDWENEGNVPLAAC